MCVAAASAYIDLALSETDNNVKLIVLDRLDDIHKKHEKVLESLINDVLRILSCPDFDVRSKTIAIVMNMVSGRNVDEVVGFFKKEFTRSFVDTYEKHTEYQQLLTQTIHKCAVKFPIVAPNVVQILMESLNEDASNSTAVDVIAFIR